MTIGLGFAARDAEGNQILWQPYQPCPCSPEGCGVTASKLVSKTGHVRGCNCVSCRNRRNRAKGRDGERRRHLRLGGQGFTPQDELGVAYSVEVVTQDKVGKQVPASFVKLIDSEWFRHAISQAERSIPVGVQANASLYLEPAGGGAFLVTVLVPRQPAKGAS